MVKNLQCQLTIKVAASNYSKIEIWDVFVNRGLAQQVDERHNNKLQHAATSPGARPEGRNCNTQQHAVTNGSTQLQHAATRCNTLQHAATRCNTAEGSFSRSMRTKRHTATQCGACIRGLAQQVNERQCNKLTQSATGCNRLQQAATGCNRLQQATTQPTAYSTGCWATLQHIITRCNTLQHTETQPMARQAGQWVSAWGHLCSDGCRHTQSAASRGVLWRAYLLSSALCHSNVSVSRRAV